MFDCGQTFVKLSRIAGIDQPLDGKYLAMRVTVDQHLERLEWTEIDARERYARVKAVLSDAAVLSAARDIWQAAEAELVAYQKARPATDRLV